MNVLLWTVVVVAAYFLGTLNGAILISRWIMHDDVRNHGSGNAGLTNYFRTYGGVQSLLVIVIDAAKCVLSCFIAVWLLPEYGLQAKMAAGGACILGHCFPATAGFKGGKGILCGAALAACTDWNVFFLILSLFVLVTALTRYVSLASVLAAAAFAVGYLVFHGGDAVSCTIGIAVAAFVIYRHRPNIERLVKGTESKLSFHKK